MNSIPVNPATEDELSEIVLLRMLSYVGSYSVGTSYRRGGFGYLRSTISGWNHAAKGIPFIVWTDLDRYACPSMLIDEWLPFRHPNFLLRIAVREVEAWLLGDGSNLSDFSRYPRSSCRSGLMP